MSSILLLKFKKMFIFVLSAQNETGFIMNVKMFYVWSWRSLNDYAVK